MASRAKQIDLYSLSGGLRRSIALHTGLLLTTILSIIVFPGTPVRYIPTLRVDIVGLPDILKKDKDRFITAPPAEVTPSEEGTKPKEKPIKDELVFKPKPKKEESKNDHKNNQMKSALARIKALNKISAFEGEVLSNVKGNIISPGSALSGDARESDSASYFDVIHDRLKANWELPVWLSRQELNAQVQIHVDGKGIVRAMKFMKSSGNPQFDDQVRKTIEVSQPFPPPTSEVESAVLVNGILLGFPL